MEIRELDCSITFILLQLKSIATPLAVKRRLRALLRTFLFKKIVDYEHEIPNEPSPSKNRTFESWPAWDCKISFRIKKPELRRVMQLLKFRSDDFVVFDNGTKLTGEEIFSVGSTNW